jgi:hypothetical protein
LLEDSPAILTQEFADFAVWVIKIAEHSRSPNTGSNAGRLFAFLEPVLAEGAFVGIAMLLVDVADIIRAGSDAGFATHALAAVDLHGAVRLFVRGTSWADVDAGRPVAVVAQFGAHLAPEAREFTPHHLYYTSTVVFRWNIVFTLAGHYAGHAAHAP